MKRKKSKQNPVITSPEAQASALERFRPLLTEEDFAALLAELDRPLYPAFRRNPLKTQAGAEQRWAARYGWTLAPVPYCAEGWWLRAAPEPASLTLEHRLGQFYLQDAASMLPVELFDLEPASHPLILDLAASPGGKTTHLTARSLDQGLVIANDSAPDRITALRIVLQTWGAANVAVTRFPAEKYGRWFPDTFDRILLDAPCSMQSLRATDAHPMRPISPREQTMLGRRQAAMLASALAAVKPGGQIVYSTCTLAPQEDEAVLDQILTQYPHAVEITPIEERLGRPAPGLTTAFEQSFDPQVQHAARLWPHRFGTSGFFAALLTKLQPIDSPVEEAPQRPLSSVGQVPLTARDRAEINELFRTVYGFNLPAVLDEYDLELWQNPNGIYAVPARYLLHFAALPCQLLGLKVAEMTPQGWIPAHEWVSRFGNQFSAGSLEIDTEQMRLWLQGSDVALPAGLGELTPNAVVIVKDADQRILGRGHCQDNRLRNLLPRRLF